GAVGGRFGRRGGTGAQMDAKLLAGKRQLVAGEQRAADDPLTVHLGAVGAVEIAHEEQPVSAGDDAVDLRNALAIEHDIAVFSLPPDNRDVLVDGDGLTTL